MTPSESKKRAFLAALRNYVVALLHDTPDNSMGVYYEEKALYEALDELLSSDSSESE